MPTDQYPCFAWYTKSMTDDSRIGLIHAASIDAGTTACGTTLSKRWFFEDRLRSNEYISCEKCQKVLKNIGSKEANEVSVSYKDSGTKVVGKKEQVYVPKTRMVDCSDAIEATIEFHRTGRAIIAQATYWDEAPNGDVTIYKGTGYSLRNPEDGERKDIGEALAAARALNKLASLMYRDVMNQVHERCVGHNKLHKLDEDSLVQLRKNVTNELEDRYKRQSKRIEARDRALEEMASLHIENKKGAKEIGEVS